MSVENTIARPYARAIFEIAVSTNSLQKWKETLIFMNMIVSCKEIKHFLSGSLSSKYLSSIFIQVSDRLIDKNAENLIKLLAKNQRFNILNNILEKFLELEAHYQNILIVELRTASFLEDKQIITIQKKLEKKFSKKIKFIYKIDDDMIDGIMIKVENTVFDLSVRGSLKQLSNVLNR